MCLRNMYVVFQDGGWTWCNTSRKPFLSFLIDVWRRKITVLVNSNCVPSMKLLQTLLVCIFKIGHSERVRAIQQQCAFTKVSGCSPQWREQMLSSPKNWKSWAIPKWLSSQKPVCRHFLHLSWSWGRIDWATFSHGSYSFPMGNSLC